MATSTRPLHERAPARRPAVAVAAIAAVVLLWGGYGRDWSWTGFPRYDTLWDWLQVLVLPAALVVAPLWLKHRSRLERTRHVLLGTFAGAFLTLVVLGYALDLRWTGFPGNRLWDWLELLALPLAVGLLPVWSELSRRLAPRHAVLGGCVLAAFVVTIVGGYSYGWRWTGFQGNTLFDWIRLLIAPLLLPIVLVPLIAAWVVGDAADE